MWRQVVAQSPGENAPAGEVMRYDVGWKALNTLLKSGRSLSGYERNCCFLNTRGQRFADISSAADIDFDDDGRIIALSDWDHDGDLDFWIANRTGPQARFLRNDHANDHHFIAFKLEGTNCNRDAIGARLKLTLKTDDHPHRWKTVKAGQGYLAQCSRWNHFGLGDVQTIESLQVSWPDGSVETFDELKANQRYRIKQGTGNAELWNPPQRSIKLEPSKIQVPESSDEARIVLIAPLTVPKMSYTDYQDQELAITSETGKARLINLWATWCQPCLQELDEWKQHAQQFSDSGIEVLTINVDEPESDRAAQLASIRAVEKNLNLPFRSGVANASLVSQFDVLQRSILRRQKPLPIPCSFLVDGRGRLRVIYRGPVSTEQILADANLLDGSATQILNAAVPYPGIWLAEPAGSAPNTVAVRFIEGGFHQEAEQYLRQLTQSDLDNPFFKRTDAYVLLGALMLDQKRYEESADAFKTALMGDPHHRQSHIELAGVLRILGQPGEAAKHFEHALERRSNDPELRLKLGEVRLQNGEAEEAAKQFGLSAELRPSAVAHHNWGNALLALSRIPDAMQQFDAALQLNPNFVPSANNLAWLLATNPDSNLRDGPRAVELAEQVCSSLRKPSYLETLAVAYAEAGDFDNAIQTLEEAIAICKSTGDVKTSSKLQKRLSLFRQGKPFRDG